MKRLRAQKISIDLPTIDSASWVLVVLQRVVMDDNGNAKQVVDSVGRINKSLESFARQVVTFTDPVTKEAHTISGAGAAEAVRETILAWIGETFDGSINDKRQFIEDE